MDAGDQCNPMPFYCFVINLRSYVQTRLRLTQPTNQSPSEATTPVLLLRTDASAFRVLSAADDGIVMVGLVE